MPRDFATQIEFPVTDKALSRTEAVRNILSGAETSVHEFDVDFMVLNAAERLIELQNQNRINLDYDFYGHPEDVLSEIAGRFETISGSNSIGQQLISALENYIVSHGSDFSREANAKPLYARIAITAQKPRDLPDLELFQAGQINGRRKTGSEATQVVRNFTVYGSTTTSTQGMNMPGLFTSSEPELFYCFGVLSKDGLKGMSAENTTSLNAVQALTGVIPAAAARQIQAEIKADKISPEAVKLIQHLAELRQSDTAPAEQPAKIQAVSEKVMAALSNGLDANSLPASLIEATIKTMEALPVVNVTAPMQSALVSASTAPAVQVPLASNDDFKTMETVVTLSQPVEAKTAAPQKTSPIAAMAAALVQTADELNKPDAKTMSGPPITPTQVVEQTGTVEMKNQTEAVAIQIEKTPATLTVSPEQTNILPTAILIDAVSAAPAQPPVAATEAQTGTVKNDAVPLQPDEVKAALATPQTETRINAAAQAIPLTADAQNPAVKNDIPAPKLAEIKAASTVTEKGIVSSIASQTASLASEVLNPAVKNEAIAAKPVEIKAASTAREKAATIITSTSTDAKIISDVSQSSKPLTLAAGVSIAPATAVKSELNLTPKAVTAAIAASLGAAMPLAAAAQPVMPVPQSVSVKTEGVRLSAHAETSFKSVETVLTAKSQFTASIVAAPLTAATAQISTGETTKLSAATNTLHIAQTQPVQSQPLPSQAVPLQSVQFQAPQTQSMQSQPVQSQAVSTQPAVAKPAVTVAVAAPAQVANLTVPHTAPSQLVTTPVQNNTPVVKAPPVSAPAQLREQFVAAPIIATAAAVVTAAAPARQETTPPPNVEKNSQARQAGQVNTTASALSSSFKTAGTIESIAADTGGAIHKKNFDNSHVVQTNPQTQVSEARKVEVPSNYETGKIGRVAANDTISPAQTPNHNPLPAENKTAELKSAEQKPAPAIVSGSAVAQPKQVDAMTNVTVLPVSNKSAETTAVVKQAETKAHPIAEETPITKTANVKDENIIQLDRARDALERLKIEEAKIDTNAGGPCGKTCTPNFNKCAACGVGEKIVERANERASKSIKISARPRPPS